MVIKKGSGLGIPGKIKNIPAVILILTILLLSAASCASPPPIRPAISQTVVNVQRSATKLDKGSLIILVDDVQINPKAQMKKGQFLSFPINNGVHYIHGIVKGGGLNLVSEAINFTAANKTVSFIATVENEPGSILKKRLVISRSDVADDTGRQTNLDVQESYGN